MVSWSVVCVPSLFSFPQVGGLIVKCVKFNSLMYEGRGHDVIINQEAVCVYTLRARSNRKTSFLESGLSSVIV